MPKTSQYIPFDKLKLDLNNMRFNKIVGQMNSEDDVIEYMFNFENLDDLIKKIISKGYENDEALWVIEDGGNYIVKEGNRRLSALKVLANVKKYKDKINLKKNYNIPQIFCSVYKDSKVLNDRIIERHTQDPIKGWNRLAQSFRIQEEYLKYRDWSKVNGGSSKKDLFKVANFYQKARPCCENMINTFVKDDKDEGLSKFEVWRRLFGFNLPKNYFGFEFDKELEVKILDNDKFGRFVNHTTNLLLKNKIKSADVVKENIDNLLNQHFSDFIETPTQLNSSGTQKKDSTPSTTTPRKTKAKGSVQKKPICNRANTPPQIYKLIEECYGVKSDKHPNSKLAMTRVLLESTMKFVVEHTKHNGKPIKNSLYFQKAFPDKRFTNFTELKKLFEGIITNTGIMKALKHFDLDKPNQIIHNYNVVASSSDAQNYWENIIPIITFLLKSESDLLNELNTSKL